MTDAAASPRLVLSQADLPERMTPAEVEANRYTMAALERHKREGMDLAVRARWVALAVTAVMLPFLNPSWEMLWYELGLLALAFTGWLQRRVGQVGRSGRELLVLALDLALLTAILVLPNPLSQNDWPDAVNYRFGNFIYFFIILAAGTLAYSWRTIFAIGNWTALLWLLGAGGVWLFGDTSAELGAAARAAFGADERLLQLFDPNSVNLDLRAQEIVVFLLTAATLGLSVRRFNRLLLSNAALERERTNLSRYFSPNVVAELSNKDEPLKETRSHDVAVLFVDIVGFTAYAADRAPEEVIATLRDFHARMEAQVFAHGGTLDKYLGDGLMATFGTPAPGTRDAADALSAARAMMAEMEAWNAQRAAAAAPPLRASFGLHHGPVVLGDIGATQLEFAVIGNTVNVASRLEAMTRPLDVQLAMSEAMRAAVAAQAGEGSPLLDGFSREDGVAIRGLDRTITVWTLG